MSSNRSAKAIALVTTILMMASIFWLLSSKQLNKSLEDNLSKEKLKSESLLSEKLLLEKDIQKFKDQLAELNGKNADLNKVLTSTQAKLMSQESEYNRMKKENLTLVQVKRQRQELVALQSQLENELRAAKESYEQERQKNAQLNNTIAMLEEKNKILSDDLNRALFASVDQSQVTALKKSERLTVRAKRTKKLMATFEVPANLKQLSFRIINDNGALLDKESGTIASTISQSEKTLTASSMQGPNTNQQFQKVEMVYLPKNKLKSGVYTIEILNENLYVASVKVRLK